MTAGKVLDALAPIFKPTGISPVAHLEGTFLGAREASALTPGQAERILRALAGDEADRSARPPAARVTTVAAQAANQHESGLGSNEKVRRAEARYRTLVEQLPAVTFMAALEDGENELYVSPQIEFLLGYSSISRRPSAIRAPGRRSPSL